MSTELELEFIELAVGKGRRVQTTEGARFYGQPIGTIITPDMIKKARSVAKAKGVTPPKGGLSPKKSSQVSVGTGKASPAENFNDSPTPQPGAAVSPGNFQVKAPTIKGPQGFKVGNSQFSAPAGSKLIRPKNQPDFAYVVTPENSVHAFVVAGEIDVPDYLEPVLSKKFKDLKGDDALYKVDAFDAPSSLAEQKPGSTLSKNGKPLFKKQGSGVWMNEDIGAELTDDDLQRLYDAGSFDLEPANTVEDIDFSKLTADELQAALESMPEGKQMKFSKTVVTKKNGKWSSAATGKSTSSEDLAYMAAGTSAITDKLDNPEVEPEPGKADKVAKEADAQDPLKNPENELNEANAMKKKAKESKATGADIIKAEVGTVVYHDVHGAFTKKDKSTWENTDGQTFSAVSITDSANMGFISKEPWDSSQKEAKEKFDVENTLTVNGKKIATIAKFGENERSEKIKADGGSTPNVFELEATPENAQTFRKAMVASLEGNAYNASVYIYEADDYEGMRLFLSDDGKSGIALHDGDEIVSVFSDPKSKNKKVARHLISVAVENGGKRLDAFDTVLPSIYAKEGFVVKARMKWDEDFAPEGWDKETFKKFNNGEPDVVFMKYEKGMEDLDYEAGSGDYVDDYDKGLAATGGKAQDEDDYRPETGDPDNENTTVETTKGGSVINDEVKSFLAEGKKISAIKALKDSNKGMDLVTAKKEIEDLFKEGIQPGDKLKSHMLFDLPEGAKIRTASGGEFTKNENGNWVTKNGGVFNSHDLNVADLDGEVVANPSAKEKKIEAPKVEEPEIDPGAITAETLNALKTGDIISNGTFEFTKNENGKFEHPEFDFEFDVEDFEPDLIGGKVSIVEETGSEFEEEESPKEKLTLDSLKAMKPGDKLKGEGLVYIKHEDGTFISDTSGWVFNVEEFKNDLENGYIDTIESSEQKPASNGFKNTMQVQQAIDALEGHSGFQIKYGLKSLPEDHPLKDQETLDEEVAKATKDYPELSPKKALVKSLKVSLGQESSEPEVLADWELELLNNNGDYDKVQIGSRSSKNKATGVTGGEFFKKDVQSAIDILENYDGKLFKNELNKQGNPLGKLSPNDIVGFDKDKTLTKQKFIDLLKKKIAPEEKSQDTSAYQVFSVDELQNAQVGSKIEHTQTGAQWTKDSDGTWGGVMPSSFYAAINKNWIKFLSAPATSKAKKFDNGTSLDIDISETPDAGKVVAADTDMTALQNAPVGTIVSKPSSFSAITGGMQKFKKNEDGTWSNLSGTTAPKKSESIFFYNTAMNGMLKWDEEDSTTDRPDLDGPVNFGQAQDLPIGAVVQAPAGHTYTKKNGNAWVSSATNNTHTNDNLKAFFNSGNAKLKSMPGDDSSSEESQPGVGDKIDYAQVANLPVGTEIMTTSGTVWKKTNDGRLPWMATSKSGVDDGPYPNSSMMMSSNAGNATVKKIGDGTYESNTPVTVAPFYNPGDKLTSAEDFKNLEIGTVTKYQNPDSDTGSIYTKTSPNHWLYRHPTTDYQTTLTDDAFLSGVEKGWMYYEGGPTVSPEGEPNAPDADDSMDAVVDAHFQQMSELDKAVSVLPAEERGANGDGYVIVHTEKGPKITWGKFGGGGIATVATDENGVKKVLIGKRGDRDEWYLPGGAIDENESHLQGSLREFTEEVEDGDSILEQIQITNAYQANIGKIEGSDKDWKYVTSVATLPTLMDIKAPESTEDWELKEYQWFSADELEALDASGKLHPALGGGNLAKMVGFQPQEGDDLHADILSLMNEPTDLNEDRYDISNWKKIGGGQGGSNPGGVYEDQLGNKYYVKESNGGVEPMHNEIIGAALYKAAGVNSNEVFFVKNGDQRLLATPWVDNNSVALPNAFHGGDPEFIKKAQADFAIDAWLDNYDVAGIGPWNLVADMDGNPFRIDPGGSMMYRATGAKKDWWSDDPTAIDDMRFGSNQSSAYTHLPKLFGDMSDDDVKESAKKLLAVTPSTISSIVNSSGLDDDTKAKLYQTLVTRREKILERFGLIESKKSTPEATTGTPGFAKGTTVKIKGSGAQFKVELSNNEATAGVVDGKFLVFVNDELTSNLNEEFSTQHAFTSNGENFKKAEAVKVIDPNNSANTIDAFVLKADWSSGLVTLITGDTQSSTGVYNIEVDKSHISKFPQQAPKRIVLPEGYDKVPSGYKPLAKHQSPGSDEVLYIFESPDSPYVQVFSAYDTWSGASIQGAKGFIEDPYYDAWHAWDGSMTDAPETPQPETPVEEPALTKGDKVTITKYNKTGFSNQAQVVSINTEKGTARVRRLDENGVPMVDANGKPMYATMSLTSLSKNKPLPGASGTPTGIQMSGGDKNHALYGAAEPLAPAVPSMELPSGVVSKEWMAKAEEAYKAYRVKKSLTPKAMKDSSTAWNPIQKAMQGDQQSLDQIKSKGYLDEDPALYEEIQKAIDAHKAKYADLVAKHEAAVALFQKQKSEWMTANGVASFTPLRHEDTLQMDQEKSHEWATNKFKNVFSKLTSSAKSGIQTQKSSSSWQSLIRKLPAILGLRREDVANSPGVTSGNMQTWDQIKEATDIAGPVGEAFRAVRTIGFDRLVGPDGKQLSEGADLTQIIGSIQKDHGAMEIVPGSIDHNGKIVDMYPVIMDLAVPADVKGVYTGFSNYSYDVEHGMIMEPGLAMYIWDAQFKPVKQLGGSNKWVVKASIIPREVLPYMNNFAGDPMSHNILIPGKDTTTGVPTGSVAHSATSKDGKWSLNDLIESPALTQAEDKNGDLWIKSDTGHWFHNVNGSSVTSDELADEYMIDPFHALLEEYGNSDFPQSMTESELESLPVGTKMDENEDVTWTKISKNDWNPSNGGSNLHNLDLAGFPMKLHKTISTPSSPGDSGSAKNLTTEEIEAFPVGTQMDEHNKMFPDEKITTWTKTSKVSWINSAGSKLDNEDLAGFPMKLKNSDAENYDDLEMPLKSYTTNDLELMAVGNVVTDNDGDRWKKIGDNLWECLGPDEFFKGEKRTDGGLASYLKDFVQN